VALFTRAEDGENGFTNSVRADLGLKAGHFVAKRRAPLALVYKAPDPLGRRSLVKQCERPCERARAVGEGN
jgi:hypothetical protein